RKITPAGVVTTLAGQPGQFGRNDGIGAAARFGTGGIDSYVSTGPYGVAVDASSNVFVADGNNYTLRRVTASGIVTTEFGQAGRGGFTDGAAGSSQFRVPVSLALNAA